MARGYSEKFIRELFADESAGNVESGMASGNVSSDDEHETGGSTPNRPTLSLQSTYQSNADERVETDGGESAPVCDEESVSVRNLGRVLAKTCVVAKIPMSYVAAPLGVSKLTVFNWFHGKPIRTKYHPLVEAFISVVERDTKEGLLPAVNNKAAKAYIELLMSDDG